MITPRFTGGGKKEERGLVKSQLLALRLSAPSKQLADCTMRALLCARALVGTLSTSSKSLNGAASNTGMFSFMATFSVLLSGLPRVAATEERCRRDCTLPINVTKLEWEVVMHSLLITSIALLLLPIFLRWSSY